MLRFSAILLHCFTLAMHSISCHGTVEKCMEICVFRITSNKRDWEILTGYCSLLFFLPFCLFVVTFGQKELIQLQIYTMQRYYCKSRLPDWGQSFEELVWEMKAPGNQLLTRAIMWPIMALGSSLLILILISLSNSLVLQAYQSWVRANGRENPLPDLSMSVDQLFFIGFATVCFYTPAFFPPSPLPVVVA